MRTAMVVVLSITGLSISAGVAGANATSTIGSSKVTRMAGCAVPTGGDSLLGLTLFRSIVSDTGTIGDTFRGPDQFDLPALPADSVQYGGTGAQCDSVAARYSAYRDYVFGGTMPIRPIMLMRAGPTRWIGDPRVGASTGHREFSILDSTFHIIKIFGTYR